MEFKEVFSRRLSDARKIRQMSQKALSDAMQSMVSSSAIDKYEKGLSVPSSTILIALSKALNMKPDYFFTPYTIDIDYSKFEFRKKAKLGVKAIEAIKLRVGMKLEDYFSIEEVTKSSIVCNLLYQQKLVRTEQDAIDAAQFIRKLLGLDDTPVSSPISLLEDNGVKILELDEQPDFDGTSSWVQNTPVIVLNANKHSERNRLTLFHELGHLMMSIPADVDDKKKENLCNVFANEMLLSSKLFYKLFGKKNDGIYTEFLVNIQRIYGISPDALMMKARQLGVISASRHKYFHIRMNQNAWLKETVHQERYPKEHPRRYQRLVLQALDNTDISIGKAAVYLNTSVSSLVGRITTV